MSAPVRPSLAARKGSMRPPSIRPPPIRAQTATPTLNGRMSPTASVASDKLRSPARSVNGGTKRKEREFEHEGEEETNINVVVRCRGRNDREVRENSGVVVSTNGVRGNKVELSMGANALSNKTYSFDKVFSPAADQDMLFQDVVSPILDEVLSGFNCTIFAYGQTGTGKTYTMSGDITETLPLPDGAGIIPRVLYSLFERLRENEEEHSVKCSFIELYNEELRDLLSLEENSKLKIYDDNSKKGQTTTQVQGMEESHIKSASRGLELLRKGSHKRQVAATKCNDLSSRSHTVFTVTVYMKRTSETGEDFVSAGKLNLVDLAGSENIQRSGAEHKRAAEAGLINKSLLTLGRVINALVEKSSHIPYRESKLTRLLQDSLGGRTKTCIIATLSPAKSNLEETISTLDYAFRAKNIRNKPQVNQLVSKKTVLREFTAEIEKLKGELIATRQRNGVYLTQESYEEMTTESESRRILSEEQRDKIETMETNLRNKLQELFNLTSNLNGLKKDNEATRFMLDGTQGLLDKTEIVLAHTKRSLAEESYMRKAHQSTESQLITVGEDLLSTLEATTGDIHGLHSKLRRRSDLHSVNRSTWGAQRDNIVSTTHVIDQRLEELREQQEALLSSLSSRMQSFVTDELRELQQSQQFLETKAKAFQKSEEEVNSQTAHARDEMNAVLAEIKTLREDVKGKAGAGLGDMSGAAQRISAGISSELDGFHTQLHSSYASLGREFKSIFDDVIRQMNEQQAEVTSLRQQITTANSFFVEANQNSQQVLQQAMDDERRRAAVEREQLLSRIGSLIQSSAESQEQRMAEHLENASKRVKTSEDEYTNARQSYDQGMGVWAIKSQSLIESCVRSREGVKSKIKADWSVANETTGNIKMTTEAVHNETVNIVTTQMAHMDTQLLALDEIISRVKAQNEQHHAAHTSSLGQLSSDVQESYTSIGQHMATSYTRTQNLGTDMRGRAELIAETLPSLSTDGDLRKTLCSVRDDVAGTDLMDYVPTGQTPAKTVYTYPAVLPRTATHDVLLERMRSGSNPDRSPSKANASPRKVHSSPTKGLIFNDDPSPSDSRPLLSDKLGHSASAPLSRSTATSSLREIDVNITASAPMSVAPEVENIVNVIAPPVQKVNVVESKLPMKRPTRMTVAGVAEGRENLGGSGGPGGRRLRTRGSN